MAVVENATGAKRITALKRTALFGCLTREELSEIARRAAEIHFSKGEMLFLSGEPVKGIFVVVGGDVRVFQHNAEGREQVMHVDTAGSVIAEVAVFDGGPYPASAMAMSGTDVLFIPKESVDRCCADHPHFVLNALRLMARRVRRHAQLVEALSLHEVGQRLALFLLTEARSAGNAARGEVAIPFSLSNHEIAIRIGSVRDVVSRAFTRLKHEGLIATEGAELTIPDLRALRRYASNAGISRPRKDPGKSKPIKG